MKAVVDVLKLVCQLVIIIVENCRYVLRFIFIILFLFFFGLLGFLRWFEGFHQLLCSRIAGERLGCPSNFFERLSQKICVKVTDLDHVVIL